MITLKDLVHIYIYILMCMFGMVLNYDACIDIEQTLATHYTNLISSVIISTHVTRYKKLIGKINDFDKINHCIVF